ncbi:hypothetical protein MSC49_37690 (plasmid) [Methylosinus sp. C49]|uniref:hypothetical protein n=1 Tax=Methylosinus sp. C49 TaxID=2699395 RepID=UPI001366F8B4|nr:hypothetical protein [Methylosinus sp. C49]BBU63834.1 hypothetical protein MSC49_37690 [Methylosinus sp. C49]
MAVACRTYRFALSLVLALALGASAEARAAAGPLETLLIAFTQGKREKDIAALSNIEWQGFAYPEDSEKDLGVTYHLRGRLRLNGFGEVDLPIGIGANATHKKGNEGDASIDVIFHSAKGVRAIELQKFYPSGNYQEILQRQLSGGTVTLLADNCKTGGFGDLPDDEHTAFFRIDLPAATTPVFVRAGRNEAGGKNSPGETFFSFSLFTPGSDLTKRACVDRVEPTR